MDSENILFVICLIDILIIESLCNIVVITLYRQSNDHRTDRSVSESVEKSWYMFENWVLTCTKSHLRISQLQIIGIKE